MNSGAFSRDLANFAARWRFGRGMAALFAVVALFGLLLLLVGVLDYWAGLEDHWRRIIHYAWWGCALLCLGTLCVRAMMFSRREAAQKADLASGDPRRSVLGALELIERGPAGELEAGSVEKYLTERELEQASGQIRRLKRSQSLPLRGLQRAALAVLIASLCLTAAWLLKPDAFHTVAQRLLFPDRDIPPWNPLVFTLSPEAPKVIYGGDAELKVTISGAPVREQVWFLTREPGGEVRRVTAFALGGAQYGQRLDNVTSALEIAFSSEKARSQWTKVELLRQPRVEALAIKITPPAYSGLPSQDVTAGSGEITALPGSLVEARLQSNRPLSGGVATLTPVGQARREAEVLEMRSSGEKEVVFRWQVKHAARIKLEIKDIIGTGSAAPVELEQKIIPDRPPVVSLQTPAGIALATPDSEIPLEASAEDDLGLGRVDMVRTLSGFRDRAQLLQENVVERHYDFQQPIQLAKLGVAPGQTLEFYLQAHDHNPSLMGIGSSDVGRIQIISVEDYAELLRARTTLAEFSERYRTLDEAVKRTRAALEALSKAAQSGTESERAEALKQALESQRATADLAKALAKDFVAFDSEKQLSAAAEEIEKLLREQSKTLEGQNPADAQGLAALADKQREELGDSENKASALRQKAEYTTKVAAVMEMAAELRVMYDRQKKLTEGLEKIAREIMLGNTTNAAQAEQHVQQQKRNLEAWKSWLPELKARAEALPGGYEQLKTDTLKFHEAAEQSEIQRSMEQSLEQARKDRTPDAFVNSQFALLGIEQLMSQPGNCFGESCQSNQPRFQVPHPDLQSTMRQMMEGICRRKGIGEGKKPGQGGTGTGSGGDGNDGYSMEGDPLMQSPLFGPERLGFREHANSGAASLNNSRKDSSRQRNIQSDSASDIQTVGSRGQGERRISLQEVPESYREAVRRFYGEDEVTEGTSSQEKNAMP